jgi:hypothetical protein
LALPRLHRSGANDAQPHRRKLAGLHHGAPLGRCGMIGWGGGPEDLRTFQRRSDWIAAAAALVWVVAWAVTR